MFVTIPVTAYVHDTIKMEKSRTSLRSILYFWTPLRRAIIKVNMKEIASESHVKSKVKESSFNCW
jgi:hypothetical protein